MLSDTYLLGSNIVNTAHVTVNRSRALRVVEPYFTPADLRSQVYSPIPGFAGISVTGNGFSLGAGAVNPGYFNSLAYEAGDDINWIKGSHQIAFGGNWIHGILNSDNNRPTNGQFTFSGQTTGSPMADLLMVLSAAASCKETLFTTTIAPISSVSTLRIPGRSASASRLILDCVGNLFCRNTTSINTFRTSISINLLQAPRVRCMRTPCRFEFPRRPWFSWAIQHVFALSAI